MSRLIGRAVLAVGIATATVLLVAAPVAAQGPEQQGWWAAANPGGLPVSPPAGPDVPEDGLLVQAGASGPSAYAALLYRLDGGTADRLTLEVAPNSGTTPSAALVLCPLKDADFMAAQGGPVADAPAYDCKRQATATLAGTSFSFRVGGLVTDGVLAVAILPGDGTTRAVLSKPGDDSLAATAATPSSPPVISSGARTATEGAGTAVAPRMPALSSGTTTLRPAGGSPVVQAPTTAAAPAVAAPVASPAGVSALSAAPVASTTPSNRAVLRVLGLLGVAAAAVAGALWAFAGGDPAMTPLPVRDPV